MRALIQRVHSGSVSVRHPELHNHALPPSHPSQPEPQSITKVGKGAVVFLGISAEDTLADCDYVLRKTMSLRLWPDNDDEEKNKQWTKSLLDLHLDVLFVSQFTLLAECTKGKKPSFSRAMTPKEAKEMYDLFVQKARDEYKENGIKEGQFGAMMDVHIENDGPETVLIDSQNKGG